MKGIDFDVPSNGIVVIGTSCEAACRRNQAGARYAPSLIQHSTQSSANSCVLWTGSTKSFLRRRRK